MTRVDIKSKDLKDLIYYKLNSDNNIIYDANLENIKDIVINKYDLNGNKNDIDLSEIIFFKNIEVCIISNFQITDRDIEILNKLSKLKRIQFTNCEFLNKISRLELNLEYLVIETCRFRNLDFFVGCLKLEQIKILNCRNVNLDMIEKFENVKKIYIQNCNIVNINKILGLNNLQYINIEKSKIDNDQIVTELKKNSKVKLKI